MTPLVNTVRAPAPVGGARTQLQGTEPQFPAVLPTLDVGTRIGDYTLTKKLGAGGMGAVFLARDAMLDRDVAIKVLLPEFSTNAEAQERFNREARAAAAITHDNVVSVYQVGNHEGRLFLVMPLLRGYSLDSYLEKKGLPAVRQAIRIARELLLGLSAAHARGLIHRDIKPGNIWLEAPNGRVKILDFGIAKPSTKEESLTKSGVLMGTPAYMSPEQARGFKVDLRTDLFSVGALLYRMCVGVTPFARESVMETLTALVLDEPQPPHERNIEVTLRLSRFILRLLAKKPESRFATCQEALEELRAVERELADGKATVSGVIAVTATDVRRYQPDPGFEIIPEDTHPVVEQKPMTVRTPKQATRRLKRKNRRNTQQLLLAAVVSSLGIMIMGVGIGWLLSYQKGTTKKAAVPKAAMVVEPVSQVVTIPEKPIAQEP